MWYLVYFLCQKIYEELLKTSGKIEQIGEVLMSRQIFHMSQNYQEIKNIIFYEYFLSLKKKNLFLKFS